MTDAESAPGSTRQWQFADGTCRYLPAPADLPVFRLFPIAQTYRSETAHPQNSRVRFSISYLAVAWLMRGRVT